MKNLLITLLLCPLFLFAQEDSSESPYENYKKWHLELGIGTAANARAHDLGPVIITNTSSFISGIHARAGLRYNFTDAFGLRFKGAYNTFSADTDRSTIDYTSTFFQTSAEAVFNIGNMANFQNWTDIFNLQFYAGSGVGFLIYDSDAAAAAFTDDREEVGLLIVGFTPMFKLSDNISLVLDGQLMSSFDQDRNWSGATPTTTRAVDGFVTNFSAGLNIALGKDKSEGSIDWYVEDKTDEFEDEIARLDRRVNELEGKVNEIPVDEIGKVSDDINTFVTNYVDDSRSDFNTVESLISDEYIRIFFDFDSDMPNTSSVGDISTLVNFMNNNDVNIELIGMTDVLGSESYNDGLSLRRAQNVKDILVAAGVDESKVEAKGNGENPVYNSKNEYIRMLARTVTVKLK